MHIINGNAYADQCTNKSEIISVKAFDDMMLFLTFSGWENRLFDATILQSSAFEPLKDSRVFKTAIVEYGSVVWLNGDIDCAPEYHMERAKEMS